MPAELVIKVEHLSKRYRLGTIGSRTLKDEWSSAWSRLRRPNPHPATGRGDIQGPRIVRSQGAGDLWALNDVNFELRRGEVLGIIGRNGAGKSTLLKILSRITAPTSGRVKLKGRVASLLEVGTGFHPELTGRENVFLNGVILGMTRAEIKERFDEIVAFSGVEAFIDTPVKRYSTGMQVRLAFAVAAHLDPDILIVDEVLAVGDIAFQKKCLGKMGDVVRGGRTILFVSHNMQAVRALCPRSLLIDGGRVVADGPSAFVAGKYHEVLRNVQLDANTDVQNQSYRRGSGAVRFNSIAVVNPAGDETFSFRMGETVRFRLSYEVFRPMPDLVVIVVLQSSVGGDTVTSVRHTVSSEPLEAGRKGRIAIDLPDIAIRPGEYPLYFWIGDSDDRDFDIVDGITVPLIIAGRDEARFSDRDLVTRSGVVSIPSRLVVEAHQGHSNATPN